MRFFHQLTFALAALTVPVAPVAAAEDVMIVYDASGSMWAQVDGVNKIVIAREVMADLLKGWPQDTRLGLIAYGHRSAGDCSDIETLIEPGAVDRQQFIETVNNINPKGKTPISAALQQAAEVLSYRDSTATVVLISDGLETCHADACAVAQELSRQGVKFTAHVVGFDLDEAGNQALSCVAKNTGGIFVPAGNASELKAALLQVQTVVEQPEQVKPEPQPQPEPEPAAAIGLGAPEQVTTGASFEVSWTTNVHPSDFVTIVPADAKEGARQNHLRVRDKRTGTLVAPADPGLYEVRYVLDQGGRTQAVAAVEVVAAEVGVAAPAQITTGASFEVSWTMNVHPSDFVTIVPADAKEGARQNHLRVRDKRTGTLVAPADPGLYEVRYVLDQGGRTQAVAAVEVVAAQVTINGPDVVRAGSPVAAAWSGVIHRSDYVTIVPAGAKQGTRQNHIRVGDKVSGEVRAPGEPGLYELRYVLDEGGRTLASHNLEVVAANAPLDEGAGLKVPAQAAAGQTITVSWVGGSDGKDQRIALAKADQADFSWIAAHKIGADKTLELTLPAEPGRYEVRYLDISGRKVVGRAFVEVN